MKEGGLGPREVSLQSTFMATRSVCKDGQELEVALECYIKKPPQKAVSSYLQERTEKYFGTWFSLTNEDDCATRPSSCPKSLAILVGRVRFERTTNGLKVRCSTD